MSQFARNWLDIWCFLVVLFGAVLAGAAWPQTDEPAYRLLSFLNPTVHDTLNDTERFAVGLMGAVTIGWGLTLFFSFAPHINMGRRYGATSPLWPWFGMSLMGRFPSPPALASMSIPTPYLLPVY